MTRHATLALALLATLTLATSGFGQDTQPAATARNQAQQLQQQINELKAAHEALVGELKAIHAAAVKEQATETAAKVKQLITYRETTLQATLRPLQQRHMLLEQAVPGVPARRGRPAPDFELTSFDGKTVKLSDHRGKIVVLEWFNQECPFCRHHYEESPAMVNLAKKWQEKGVVWLAIDSTNHITPAANIAFAKKHELPFAILDDRSGEVGHAYGARTTPHMFIVDTDGAIVYEGAIDNAPMGRVAGGGEKVNHVDQALAQLTTGRMVTTSNTKPYGCSVKYASQ
jgi:peroxiredoxin